MVTTNTQRSAAHWWWMGIRGVLAIIFGIIAIFLPAAALLAIIYVFAIYAFVNGFVAIVSAIQERNALFFWWLVLIEGIIGVIFGILAFSWPGETALILLFLIAIWSIITGILEIIAAFTPRTLAGQGWILGIGGAISIIFGIILLIHPGIGLLTLLLLIGIYAIFFGVVLLVHAFQHRSLSTSILR